MKLPFTDQTVTPPRAVAAALRKPTHHAAAAIALGAGAVGLAFYPHQVCCSAGRLYVASGELPPLPCCSAAGARCMLAPA